MALRDWLDIDAIQAISRHASAVVTALLAFILVAVIIHIGLRDGLLKETLELIDGFILIGLLLMLGWKLFALMIRGNPRDGSHYVLVA